MSTNRVNYAELYAYGQRLKENPGTWEPVPTYSKNPDQVVARQRAGLIPALPPEAGYVSKQVDYVAMAAYEPGGDTAGEDK